MWRPSLYLHVTLCLRLSQPICNSASQPANPISALICVQPDIGASASYIYLGPKIKRFSVCAECRELGGWCVGEWVGWVPGR